MLAELCVGIVPQTEAPHIIAGCVPQALPTIECTQLKLASRQISSSVVELVLSSVCSRWQHHVSARERKAVATALSKLRDGTKALEIVIWVRPRVLANPVVGDCGLQLVSVTKRNPSCWIPRLRDVMLADSQLQVCLEHVGKVYGCYLIRNQPLAHELLLTQVSSSWHRAAVAVGAVRLNDCIALVCALVSPASFGLKLWSAIAPTVFPEPQPAEEPDLI